MKPIVCSEHREKALVDSNCVYCQLASEVAKREEAEGNYLVLLDGVGFEIEQRQKAEAELERTKNPKAGICCSCGYTSTDEGPCPRRDSGTHCGHWDATPDP